MEHNRSLPKFLFYLVVINKEEIKVKDYKYDYKKVVLKKKSQTEKQHIIYKLIIIT